MMQTLSGSKKYVKIPMDIALNSRRVCSELADEIYDEKLITGMSRSQLACEIFAHVYVFCNYRFIPCFIKDTDLLRRVYTSVSDGIDLEDNGDSIGRRIFYRVVWLMPSLA